MIKSIKVNKKNSIITLAFLMFLSYSFAQKTTMYNKRISSDELKNSLYQKSISLKDIEINGSPYLYENFMIGKIQFISDKNYINAPLRYNIYTDTFEYSKEPDDIFNINRGDKIVFSIKNKTFKYLEFNLKGKTTSGYLEEIGDNLFLKRTIIVSSPKKAQSSYEKDKPARYKGFNYILYKSDKKIKLLPKKKKEIVKVFGEKSNSIASYVKTHKLNYKKEKDLIRIFNYYATIN